MFWNNTEELLRRDETTKSGAAPVTIGESFSPIWEKTFIDTSWSEGGRVDKLYGEQAEILKERNIDIEFPIDAWKRSFGEYEAVPFAQRGLFNSPEQMRESDQQRLKEYNERIAQLRNDNPDLSNLKTIDDLQHEMYKEQERKEKAYNEATEGGHWSGNLINETIAGTAAMFTEPTQVMIMAGAATLAVASGGLSIPATLGILTAEAGLTAADQYRISKGLERGRVRSGMTWAEAEAATTSEAIGAGVGTLALGAAPIALGAGLRRLGRAGREVIRNRYRGLDEPTATKFREDVRVSLDERIDIDPEIRLKAIDDVIKIAETRAPSNQLTELQVLRERVELEASRPEGMSLETHRANIQKMAAQMQEEEPNIENMIITEDEYKISDEFSFSVSEPNPFKPIDELTFLTDAEKQELKTLLDNADNGIVEPLSLRQQSLNDKISRIQKLEAEGNETQVLREKYEVRREFRDLPVIDKGIYEEFANGDIKLREGNLEKRQAYSNFLNKVGESRAAERMATFNEVNNFETVRQSVRDYFAKANKWDEPMYTKFAEEFAMKYKGQKVIDPMTGEEVLADKFFTDLKEDIDTLDDVLSCIVGQAT